MAVISKAAQVSLKIEEERRKYGHIAHQRLLGDRISEEEGLRKQDCRNAVT